MNHKFKQQIYSSCLSYHSYSPLKAKGSEQGDENWLSGLHEGVPRINSSALHSVRFKGYLIAT